ncbi:hypothetical protein FEDK69T_24660 [Flavobacterium enshiense DK69]|nr:hypothetical protein FEDK69T_24660 [Flavobacterium enshiense DK69]
MVTLSAPLSRINSEAKVPEIVLFPPTGLIVKDDQSPALSFAVVSSSVSPEISIVILAPV